MTIIKDGAGSGDVVEVDSTNRLRTRSVSDTGDVEALKDGRAFITATGVVNLTTDCVSFLIHLKNCDDRDIFVYEILSSTGTSTCGAGDRIHRFAFCPTGGTLICCGASSVISNLNLGSGLNASCVTATVGAEGSTIVGFSTTSLFPEAARQTLTDVAVVPKGASFAIGVTPPTGNTSMNAYFAIKFYFIEDT